MTHIKKAAGQTAAADNARLNYLISLISSVKAAFIRYGAVLATIFRGLA